MILRFECNRFTEQSCCSREQKQKRSWTYGPSKCVYGALKVQHWQGYACLPQYNQADKFNCKSRCYILLTNLKHRFLQSSSVCQTQVGFSVCASVVGRLQAMCWLNRATPADAATQTGCVWNWITGSAVNRRAEWEQRGTCHHTWPRFHSGGSTQHLSHLWVLASTSSPWLAMANFIRSARGRSEGV